MRATRREFCTSLAAGVAATTLAGEKQEGFRLRYIIASSLYGRLKLVEILPEVRRAGAEHLDLWPEPHANPREQMEAMGHERFAALLARLIEDLGERLVHFYAWQHGKGCMTKLPKENELLQMPGRGPLDFGPLLAALRKIGYKGWTEVFMHPVPRGIPILPTAGEVTAEVVKAQRHLEGCLR